MRLRCGRLPIFWVAALAVASSCSAPPAAIEPASKAADLHLTGVWVAVGTFGDPAGPPPWSNTPWPANPPFTDVGRSESARLSDIKNVVPCQPGGPIFAMWNLGLFPIEILEATATAPASELLETLTLEQREAIEAHHIKERGYAEIAAGLRCSESVIRKRVSRGLAALHAQLQKERTS